MKLLVGLGNPGKKYQKTRHNIGARTLELLAKGSLVELEEKRFSSFLGRGKVEGQELLFVLPQTFMNRSGEAVRELLGFYRIPSEEMLVIHDDIDLDLGRLKIDFDAGAAGHRGVLSVIEEIGTKSFFRLRLGVGRPSRREEVEPYVLSPFAAEEEEKANEICQEGVKVIKQWLRGGQR